jgi:ergothioneine biosynthesis protein EgtC
MCRLTLYLGPPVRLSALLLDPDHSLIRQSTHSHEREEPLNGDGFGVGWYQPEFSEEPAVFRSITPAWNNRNLHNLARVVASTCILAHVRAATQLSGVNEANCHPFRYGRYLFMHNGDIGNFRLVRRRLLETVSDDAYNNVYGSTDSEHMFALFIDELSKGSHTGAMALAVALDRAINRVTAAVREHGLATPCFLNVAVSDGENAAISRFTDDPDSQPESLYYFTGHLYDAAQDDHRGRTAVVVSSERLTVDVAWQPIPRNHIILLSRGQQPILLPCGQSQHVRVA